MLQLTFNPGLTLTGFRRTRPSRLILNQLGLELSEKSGPRIDSLSIPMCDS